MQGRIEYRSLFWPFMLIGVGLIWLLSNLGVLSPGSISVLFRLWPLILIVIGLDLLFGRRSPVLGGLIGLGSVALLIVLMLVGPSLGWAADTEVKSASFSEPLNGAASARVELNLGVGELNVRPLTSGDSLFEADINYLGEVEFRHSGTAERFISLSERTQGPTSISFGLFDLFFRPEKRLEWRVGLSRDVPLNLTISTGTGSSTLELADLNLTRLAATTGTGSINLVLPAVDASYDAEVRTGTGSGTVRIADGAALRLVVSSGTGGLTIDVPGNAAVRLSGSTGTGSINVPARFNRISGGGESSFVGDSGVWETEGFSAAERQIIIEFSTGTGSVTVR